MEQKTIEQAAKKAIRIGWLCDNGEYPCEDKDNCKFCNGTSRCFGTCEGDAEPYFDGFLDGARWRINSVWHDARNEIPEEFKPILAERDNLTFSVNMAGRNMASCPAHWVRWAYIADLLPDGKEDGE